MRLLIKARRRLRLLFARDRVEREQAREMASHLYYAAREHERAGVPPAEAMRRARREFGHLGVIAEAARDARGGRGADELARDLRHALRQLRRTPAHAAATIGMLTIAVAGVTLALSLYRSYVLRPLPLPEADRLVTVIAGLGPGRETEARRIAQVDWTPADALFEATAAWDLDGFTLVQSGAAAEYVDGAWVSPGYFTLLGLVPAIGRPFGPDDYVVGSNVALISDGLWRGRFGADSGVVGRAVRMHSTDRPDDDVVVMIVGVLPPFDWHLNGFTDVLRPLGTPRAISLARLPVGMSPEDGARRLTEMVKSQVGIPDPAWQMSLVSTQTEYTQAIRPALGMLAGAAALLLLLTNASVGALLVARGTGRTQELAMRRVLGASRGRLARQLGVEALLLSAIGLAFGVLAAALLGPAAGTAVAAFGGVPVPGGTGAVRVDGAVLALVLPVVLIPYLGLALLPAAGLARVPEREAFESARISGGTAAWPEAERR